MTARRGQGRSLRRAVSGGGRVRGKDVGKQPGGCEAVSGEGWGGGEARAGRRLGSPDLAGHVSSHLPLGAMDASEWRGLCCVRSGVGGRGAPRGESNCQANGPQSAPASGPVRSGPRAAVVRPGGQRRPAVLSSQDARGPLAAPEHMGHGRRGFRRIPTTGLEGAPVCGITH